MIRRKSCYTRESDNTIYVPLYKTFTHVSEDILQVDVNSGAFGLYPGDIIKLSSCATLDYSSTNKFEIVGTTFMSSRMPHVLCGKVINPRIKGYEGEVIYMRMEYMFTERSIGSTKPKLQKPGIIILQRNPVGLHRYRQYDCEMAP